MSAACRQPARAKCGGLAVVGYVSPHYGHPVRASGWRATCSCGWQGAVMRTRLGAELQLDLHSPDGRCRRRRLAQPP